MLYFTNYYCEMTVSLNFAATLPLLQIGYIQEVISPVYTRPLGSRLKYHISSIRHCSYHYFYSSFVCGYYSKVAFIVLFPPLICVWLLFKGGVYCFISTAHLRVATIQRWRLLFYFHRSSACGYYSKVAFISLESPQTTTAG